MENKLFELARQIIIHQDVKPEEAYLIADRFLGVSKKIFEEYEINKAFLLEAIEIMQNKNLYKKDENAKQRFLMAVKEYEKSTVDRSRCINSEDHDCERIRKDVLEIADLFGWDV